MKVGFLGLGAMGVGMAGCIVKKHSLRVFNRSPGKAADLVARGADLATSVEDLGDCDVVCSMLSDDAAVEAVFLNRAGGNLPIRKGAAHLSHSTISPGMTARLASAHARQDIEFLSAPVLGRPDRAASGTLVGILAGPEAVVAACRPVIDAYASKSYWVGAEARMGAIAKIGVNFLVAATLESLAEGFALIRKAGIDAEAFLSLITETIFDAQVHRAYGPLVARELNQAPGFKTALGLKDVGLARSEAERLGAELPMAALVADRLSQAIAAGYGDEDWSSLARLAARRVGLSPPPTSADSDAKTRKHAERST